MDTVKIDARDVNFWYGDFHALKGISMQIEEKSVVAFIGPSGCGKSTFLRLFNRMNDLIPATRLEGEIRIDGQNIYAKGVEVDELRKNVGMVFQRPNPFPKSIFENVAYGLRVNGVKDNAFIRQRVEEKAPRTPRCSRRPGVCVTAMKPTWRRMPSRMRWLTCLRSSTTQTSISTPPRRGCWPRTRTPSPVWPACCTIWPRRCASAPFCCSRSCPPPARRSLPS